MSNLILALNSGSSSLKITLYARRSEQNQNSTDDNPVDLILNASISNITAPPAKFSFTLESPAAGLEKEEYLESIHDHATAFAHFLQCLAQDASIDKEHIAYICHRVVHGGDYRTPVIIDEESYHHIEHLSDLAPLHNGAALSVIKACIDKLPNAKSIAYFDTTFHRPIPIHIASYAIDHKVAEQKGLKKYGFHGLSYAYILRAVSKYLKQRPENLNLIVLHLGSGASACAIKNGLSLDTSMGLTPLNGLPGATRSGAIDPSLIFHYTNRASRITHDPNLATHVGVTLAEDILNRKSGWKALTGTTDFRIICEKAELNDPNPELAAHNPYRLAFDLFVDRILNYVGSYYLKLEGKVDAIVFAGGIGERSVELRETIAQRIQCLGFQPLDTKKNRELSSTENVVSISEEVLTGETLQGKGKRILVCHTDEQFEMANDCALDERRWDSDTNDT